MSDRRADPEALLAEVDRRGYAVVRGVLDGERVERVREAYYRLARTERESSGEAADRGPKPLQRVFGLAVKDPLFVDLLCHPLIVELWRRYLGEGMFCSSWSGITLWPGHAELSWHVDHPYWTLGERWDPGLDLAVQTLWLLDDFTAVNGATAALPFSHRRGRAPDFPATSWPAEAEVLTAPRGSVILAHGAFWHSFRPNRSPAPRSALLGTYVRREVEPVEDLRGQLAELTRRSPPGEGPGELLVRLMGDGR